MSNLSKANDIVATCTDCRYDVGSLAMSNNFSFLVEKARLMSSNVTEVLLPDITMGSVVMPTSLKDISRQGSSIEYGTVEATFMIDHKWETYFEIHNWLKEAKDPEHGEDHHMTYSDGSMIFLNDQGTPVRYIRFVDMFPTNLGSVSFNVGEAIPLQCQATFAYDYFEEVPVGIPEDWDNTGEIIIPV